MAKSRTPLLLLGLAWAGPVQAQAVNAQALVEAQQQRVRSVVRPGCRTSDDPEDIVVCGRRGDRGPQGPLPALPYAPDPGTIRPADRAGGEQRDAMTNDRCHRLCHQPVQVNIVSVGAGGTSGALSDIGEAIQRLGDDE